MGINKHYIGNGGLPMLSKASYNSIVDGFKSRRGMTSRNANENGNVYATFVNIGNRPISSRECVVFNNGIVGTETVAGELGENVPAMSFMETSGYSENYSYGISTDYVEVGGVGTALVSGITRVSCSGNGGKCIQPNGDSYVYSDYGIGVVLARYDNNEATVLLNSGSGGASYDGPFAVTLEGNRVSVKGGLVICGKTTISVPETVIIRRNVIYGRVSNMTTGPEPNYYCRIYGGEMPNQGTREVYFRIATISEGGIVTQCQFGDFHVAGRVV